MPQLNEILFFDIETCPYDDIQNHDLFDVWTKKYRKDDPNLGPIEHYYKNAGLYAEFSRVVCISYGYCTNDSAYTFASITGGDELSILLRFYDILANFSRQKLCGHNIKNFDIPFLMKRYILNRAKVPPLLNTYGKKPREMGHVLDTMEIRKGTGFSSTSLEVCSLAFGFPNPKETVSGNNVAQMFFDGEIDKIKEYCEGDVKATIRLYNEIQRYL